MCTSACAPPRTECLILCPGQSARGRKARRIRSGWCENTTRSNCTLRTENNTMSKQSHLRRERVVCAPSGEAPRGLREAGEASAASTGSAPPEERRWTINRERTASSQKSGCQFQMRHDRITRARNIDRFPFAAARDRARALYLGGDHAVHVCRLGCDNSYQITELSRSWNSVRSPVQQATLDAHRVPTQQTTRNTQSPHQDRFSNTWPLVSPSPPARDHSRAREPMHFLLFFPPVNVSVVCPTAPNPPLRLARRPNWGQLGWGGVGPPPKDHL